MSEKLPHIQELVHVKTRRRKEKVDKKEEDLKKDLQQVSCLGKKIRTLRTFLKLLREKEVLNATNYRKLYQKSKGGYFRNKRHMKLYIEENKLTAARETEKTKAAA